MLSNLEFSIIAHYNYLKVCFIKKFVAHLAFLCRIGYNSKTFKVKFQLSCTNVYLSTLDMKSIKFLLLYRRYCLNTFSQIPFHRLFQTTRNEKITAFFFKRTMIQSFKKIFDIKLRMRFKRFLSFSKVDESATRSFSCCISNSQIWP